MVSAQETMARWKEFLKFSRGEVTNLFLLGLMTAFIFTFQDWGVDGFEPLTGLQNLLLMVFVVLLTFFFRLGCQKAYALTQGYLVEFKPWFVGAVIALVISFVTLGWVPLVLIGGITVVFFTRQRLGEFRYAFSYKQNMVAAMWGIYANLILAVFFAVGLYVIPGSFFMKKGLFLNLIMGFTTLIPLPQMSGLEIFFGSRTMYVFAIVLLLLSSVLLLTQTFFGLMFAIIAGAGMGIYYLMIGSEV